MQFYAESGPHRLQNGFDDPLRDCEIEHDDLNSLFKFPLAGSSYYNHGQASSTIPQKQENFSKIILSPSPPICRIGSNRSVRIQESTLSECKPSSLSNKKILISSNKDMEYEPKQYSNSKSLLSHTRKPTDQLESSSSAESLQGPMHQFLSTLWKEKTISSLDNDKTSVTSSDEMSQKMQIDFVNDGAYISPQARKNFNVSQKPKLSRWDSSGCRTTLNQSIGKGLRHSQDTMPTLPGKNRHYELSDLKNATWDVTCTVDNIITKRTEDRMLPRKTLSRASRQIQNSLSCSKNVLGSLSARSSIDFKSSTSPSVIARREFRSDTAPTLPTRR